MSLHAHNYKIINDNNDGRLEICVECKKRLITKKGKGGRVDNRKYLKEHLRETAQPTGKTSKVFNKYYGKEAGIISKFK